MTKHDVQLGLLSGGMTKKESVPTNNKTRTDNMGQLNALLRQQRQLMLSVWSQTVL